MTIDEYISHCEEVADKCEKVCDWLKVNYLANDYIEEKAKCAAEHRQLAEWLKDYKRLRKITFQPKMGKWITKSHGFPPEPTTVCSECGFDRDFYIRARGFDKIKY